MRATREAIAEVLIELGAANPNIVALDADLAASTGMNKFAAQFPDRFFNAGVAEQNMIGTAAGLAAAGKTVFVGGFAMFTLYRALDQIRNTVSFPSLNVKLCPTHSGISVGEDGSSHQPLEDVALMRVIPTMKVVVPADFYEAKAALKAAASIPGPVYVRMGRPKVPFIYDEDYTFELGTAHVLRTGSAITILAMGVTVKMALDAAEILAQQGIEAEVINVSTIKPLDADTITASAAKTGMVLTVEEHSIVGGLGGAVSELLSGVMPTKVVRMGINDRFGASGPYDQLFKFFGLTAENIAHYAREALET